MNKNSHKLSKESLFEVSFINETYREKLTMELINLKGRRVDKYFIKIIYDDNADLIKSNQVKTSNEVLPRIGYATIEFLALLLLVKKEDLLILINKTIKDTIITFKIEKNIHNIKKIVILIA